MATEQLIILIERYLDESIRPDEREQLAALLQEPRYIEQFKSVISQELLSGQFELEADEQIGIAIRQYVQERIREADQNGVERLSPARSVHLLKTSWFKYAAAVLLMLATGAYFWVANKQSSDMAVTTVDAAPGKNGAILTLADGSQIVLDSLGNGTVADQNGAKAVLKNGQLVYDPTGKATAALAYNIMSTPKGRQFKIMLPDSTQVWLNSASSIRYPTVFAGNERKVEVTGEVYFEVAKNAKMPFKVKVNNETEIQVLGTHFNVKAYNEEGSIRTTLLEGAVRISAYKLLQTLKPGQQAQINADETVNVINDADINQVMAWKNGLFNFDGCDLKSVMREIGRWYDLEVVYESAPKPRKIRGKMQRNLTLNQLMNVLKGLDIHYRLEGTKLIVTNE